MREGDELDRGDSLYFNCHMSVTPSESGRSWTEQLTEGKRILNFVSSTPTSTSKLLLLLFLFGFFSTQTRTTAEANTKQVARGPCPFFQLVLAALRSSFGFSHITSPWYSKWATDRLSPGGAVWEFSERMV
jgi:hypothetical protein